MKKIKLSGREIHVIRSIDFSLGTLGGEIMGRTHIERGDLIDILNSLLDVGYIETNPASERVAYDKLEETVFEVNPSYALDLKEATRRR
jgi:DNA-binding MarR family transcriptional regulator